MLPGSAISNFILLKDDFSCVEATCNNGENGGTEAATKSLYIEIASINSVSTSSSLSPLTTGSNVLPFIEIPSCILGALTTNLFSSSVLSVNELSGSLTVTVTNLSYLLITQHYLF